ncbi:MAG TPA: STAS domain-containing protein [Frankiaceae bacterium]|jgi:anti-anti-sigma regulatory factor|nr:STAS domain-containing protein [Frankiaceae bacterium]
MSGDGTAGVVVVQVHGPVSRARARQLCERLEARLVERDPVCVVCRVQGFADLSVLDVLARIALLASRRHAAVRVTSARGDLQGLLALTGLAGVITLELERGGQAETGEECGVQEVVDVDDLPG